MATAGGCVIKAAVLHALEAVAPLRFAASWDNVGVLVDALAPADPKAPYRMLLTNDLSPAVLASALGGAAAPNMSAFWDDTDGRLLLYRPPPPHLEKAVTYHLPGTTPSFPVVTYHPTPFAPLKTFHAGNHAARVVLACAGAGVAVYSPHTALDSAPGGLNDWLLSGVLRGTDGSGGAVVSAITPALDGNGGGEGRIARSPTPMALLDVINAVKALLGLDTLALALPADALPVTGAGRDAVEAAASGWPVRSIAVAAGAGGSVLSKCTADVWITGEMAHHDILAATNAGACVLLTRHTHCERPYLTHYRERILSAWAALPSPPGVELEVSVSGVDADPLILL